MSLWLDRKYLNMASQNLERFVWKSSNLANFRCPFCGDSQKNKFKARCYAFEKKGSLIIHCHNCNKGYSFSNFLKQINPQLYRQYSMERYAKPQGSSTTAMEDMARQARPVFSKIKLPTIYELGKKHPAYEYLVGRKIPSEYLKRLYYAEDFKAFCDELIPDHGKHLLEDDPRIIIPFFDADNNLVYLNARTINPDNTLRYIYMIVQHDTPKIYGLERFDKTKKAYITEGPFDSMFLPNALASGGSDLMQVIAYVDKSNTTFIWDNEPRNSAIVEAMKKCIDLGCSIFIWPENTDAIDLNELILSGYTPSELAALIDSREASGLAAKFKLTQWSKV